MKFIRSPHTFRMQCIFAAAAVTVYDVRSTPAAVSQTNFLDNSPCDCRPFRLPPLNAYKTGMSLFLMAAVSLLKLIVCFHLSSTSTEV